MKKILYLMLVLLSGVLASCSEDGVDLSDLPEQVSSFVSKYYPGVEVDRWVNSSGKSTVYLRNSATIVFGNTADKSWISIDGNGGTLPQMLVYDQTPTALYRYIEENNAVNGVYSMTRDSKEYKVVLLNSRVTYDIASGKVSQNFPG